MVYVTHDQVEAMTLADKIVLLRPVAEGEGLPSIAQIGDPLTLYHRPANRFVAGFIGSPAMNFVPGTVSHMTDGSLTARVDGSPVTARVDGSAIAEGRLNAGSDVTLGIRPEHIELGHGDRTAVVSHLEHLGEHSYAYLATGPHAEPFTAKTSMSSLRIGERVPFTFPPRHVHVFTADGTAVPRVDVPAQRVPA
jgi:multiple sugar transport system ATP-binding protein